MKPKLKELQVRIHELKTHRQKNVSMPLTDNEYDMLRRLEKDGDEIFKITLGMINALQKDIPDNEKVDLDNLHAYRFAINIVTCEKCIKFGRCCCNNGITGAPSDSENAFKGNNNE